MKKYLVGLFVLLFLAQTVVIFCGPDIGLSEQAVKIVGIILWVASVAVFAGVLIDDCRTDGDLIAGAEDEDGLVFSLKTPVDELVQKDKVIFHVLKDKKG